MSYESIEEAAFKKLMAEIKCLRQEVAELKQNIPIQSGNVSSSDQVYNNKQVCMILKVSKGTLEKYRNEHLITYIKRGRKYFYSQVDIDRFLHRETFQNPSHTEGFEKTAS